MNTDKELCGKPVVDAMMLRICEDVRALHECGVRPTLAIVRVGNRPDDCSYERMALKRANAADIDVRVFELASDVTQDELVGVIESINDDKNIHGCLLFRPLPLHIDEALVCEMLHQQKDIDGITMASMAAVYAGSDGFAPCTAQAVIELMSHYGIDVAGKRVCVVGRSLVIGRPISLMLMNRNATVTMCHSRTQDVSECMREADVVVCATGRARAYGAECFKPGQTVIDVGINFDETGGMCGDVDFAEVADIVDGITPVPGGIGGITTAVLMQHVIHAAQRMNA